MNSQSTKQLNLRPIYVLVAVGFTVLLVLIWWIGSSSSSKLYEISDNARKGTDEYMDRLRLALNIQEAVTEIVAETRVSRARQIIRMPVPPFGVRLKAAKSRFQEQMKEGKKQWSSQKEHETLTEEEMAAWREVEEASQKFLDKLTEYENSPNEEDSISVSERAQPGEQAQKGQAQPGEQAQKGQAQSGEQAQKGQAQSGEQAQKGQAQPGEQGQDEQAQPKPPDFTELRIDLDKAAKKLTDAVTRVRNEILDRIVTQQQRAASEVNQTTRITLLLGIVVATFILIFAWTQIIQIRRANRQEQEAKDFARSIFDSQSNDIIVVNNDGELRAVNQAFLNRFKLPAPSLVLQDYRAALAHIPEVAAFVGKALAQPDDSSSLRERIEVRPQFGHNGQNGADTSLFDVYTSPLSITGQPGGRVVVIVDVTEAEKVREELRRTRTLSAVGQITATVAHELYNPIGAVKLNLDLLEMQISGDGEAPHTVARLRRGVEHLSTIVMDLRYLTRTRDPEPRTTDLNKLLDEVVELASDRLERSRICVERNYSPQLPQGEYDPQQLRKVFLNLLINAVEASPQNSDVELRTRYVPENGAAAPAKTNGSQGALVISVIDHGAGMSPETKRRLFEAFYTTKRNGTGLGMMITQEIVKKHGGKMEVQSEEGKGTTVSVYLPV